MSYTGLQHTIQDSAGICRAVLGHMELYRTVQNCTEPYWALWGCTLCHSGLYRAMWKCKALYNTPQVCIVWYWAILKCIELQRAVLGYTGQCGAVLGHIGLQYTTLDCTEPY